MLIKNMDLFINWLIINNNIKHKQHLNMINIEVNKLQNLGFSNGQKLFEY